MKISELEEKILKFWQEKKIFEKSLRPRSGKSSKNYSFYDGPPFATGLPHYGHILASVIKDVIPRYETMKGKRVERVWGWDCHGLPIENIIEADLGLKTKKDIEKFGVEKFNEAARSRVLEYVDDWKKIIPRIGRWVDMDNAYRTMDADYTESVWWIFKNLYDKKLIYEGYKSMHICPRCETTLSNFEVAQGYKDIRDSSVVVEFEIRNSKSETNSKISNSKLKTYLLVWTTTPWTLPGNVALAINPKIQYVEVEGQVAGNTYILARSRVESIFGSKHKIIRNVNVSELIGKRYEPLFDYYAKQCDIKNIKNGPPATLSRSECGQGWKIYGADFVKTDEGTGVVHIAPAFGADDMALGQKYKLPFIQHVGMDGKFKKEVEDFPGLSVKPKGDWKSTDNKIIEFLEKQGKLFKKEEITHSYPHCWRCDTPLLNYATSSWFVKVEAIKKGKDGLLDNNKKINWVPAHIKEGRFGKGLEDAPDWAISRSRYWGAPIPAWTCQAGKNQKSKIPEAEQARYGAGKNQKFCNKKVVIGSIEELKAHTKKSGNTYFLMRHGEAQHIIKDVCSFNVKTSVKYPLTEKGKKEVLASAQKLAKEIKGKKIDLIFSSDFLRSKQTSVIMAEAIRFPKGKIIFDRRLREVSGDSFDGKPGEKYDAFGSTREKFLVPTSKGENLTQIKHRATEFLYEVEKKYKNKTILIVSHEYTLWLMMAGAAGATPEKAIALKEAREKTKRSDEFLDTAEIVSLEFSPLPHNHDYELDVHRPYIDDIELVCECGGKMRRVQYVFDCWFESGSMPYASTHFPFISRQKLPKHFPAEFIAEGLDQTRGWFYTLHVLGTALFKKPAYRNVVVNGIILAENGGKMSKKLRNYPDPMEVVSKYGADALRYYLLSSPAVRAEDLNFSEKGVDEVYKKIILRLMNVYSFYATYAGESPLKAKSSKLKANHVLDEWIVARLKQLGGEISRALNAYELDKAARPIGEFVDDLSTWYIRRSRDRFRLGGKEKDAAIATTHFVLSEFSKFIAPFMPFVAEAVYLSLNQKSKIKNQNDNSKFKDYESVHLESWPTGVELKTKNAELRIIEDMKLVRQIVSLGLEARAKAGIKVRQPLASLKIKSKKSKIKDNRGLLAILADEINVKKIIFDDAIETDVELDAAITPELKQEGLFREFVRFVQGLRQEAGYTPKDKISVWFEIPEDAQNAIQKLLLEFKNRVGARSVEFRRSNTFDAESETKFESSTIWIGIKKV